MISGKIVDFLKFVGKIQQLVRKRSQKNNYDVICIRFHFPFIHCKHLVQKQQKTLGKCRYLIKNNSLRLSNFLQTHVFETLIIFRVTNNQINYRNICFAKVVTIFIMTARVLFFHFCFFFSKKTRTLMTLRLIPPYK